MHLQLQWIFKNDDLVIPIINLAISLSLTMKKEIKKLSNQDLKLETALLGLDGSPTKMAGLELRQFARAKETLEGSVEEIVEKLVNKIYQYGII